MGEVVYGVVFGKPKTEDQSKPSPIQSLPMNQPKTVSVTITSSGGGGGGGNPTQRYSGGNGAVPNSKYTYKIDCVAHYVSCSHWGLFLVSNT